MAARPTPFTGGQPEEKRTRRFARDTLHSARGFDRQEVRGKIPLRRSIRKAVR